MTQETQKLELSVTATNRINSGLYDDLIRKSWVSQTDQEFKDNLKDLPPSVRFETYKSIDRLISAKMLELIIKRKSDLEEQGAVKVYNKDTDTYQFKESIDIVEITNQATKIIIEEF